MKIEITSTDKLTAIDGVAARVWEGVTAGGVRCVVFIPRIAVAAEEDSAEFDRELIEKLPPGRYVPLSMIL